MNRFFLHLDSDGRWFAVNVANRAEWLALLDGRSIELDAVPEYATHIESLDQFQFSTFYYPNQPGGTL